ncbi:hypothetical protein [Streptomyces sp. NPDC060035]|uniref:hypothetical protein n=1 Tax=Streptomyces sp. NPDC060035 TaxID=3347044 RepID=UPI0036C34424
MFDLTDVIELKAGEDSSVLEALAYAKAHRAMVRAFIPHRDADGPKVDVGAPW